MKRINFLELKIHNFLSIGTIHLNFNDYEKITFITGQNLDDYSENGVGKTSIGHALWYCLTGDAPEKVKLEQLPNRKSGNKTFSVECKFEIDSKIYEIKRQPKKIEYFVDGINLTKTNQSINDDILKAFGVDKITLYQSLFVSVDGDVSFFDKKSSDKIKYIESVLNLNVFEKLFDDAKKTFNKLKSKRDELGVSVEYLKRDVQRNLSEYQNFEFKQNTKIAANNAEIDRIKKSLSSVVIPSFKKVTNYEEKKKTIELSLRSEENKLAISDNEVSRISKEISSLNQMMNCPTCGKPFDDIHSKKEKLESLSDSMNEHITNSALYNEKIESIKKQLKKVREYEILLREEHDALRLKENLHNQLKTWENHNSGILLEDNPFQKLAEQKKIELDEKEKELSDVNYECKKYDLLKFVYSPEGVKNTIIKKIIKLFNDILGNYLKTLDSPFQITFDEFFEESIIHGGLSVPYNTLSRGEKARVMLAIVFTFRELRKLQTGFQLDITFYDEIFDLGLCKNGMIRCMEILEKQNKSFVITHRSENIDLVRYGKIELKKYHGITTINDKR